MCGFTGFIDKRRMRTADEIRQICNNMSEQLQHRGPDDDGVWIDTQHGIALGHRRLSIIDLSPSGHQPMTTESGRMVIAYNGEIYNFPEIRKELERKGHKFYGTSDTEVILAACEEWGVEQAVRHFIGMFAFALWDRKQAKLWLVRDRMGIKPLYWGYTSKGDLIFGSELKALCMHPDFSCEVDRDSIASFLRHNYIPAPSTIYQKIYKLKPGHMLSFAIESDDAPQIACYWDLKNIAKQAQKNHFIGNDEEMIETLKQLLMDAVGKRMIADVPLGCFLSGGIDSSLVTALMQAQSNKPINSFSIGFHEQGYDEAKYAKTIAHHLGTNHTELYVTEQQAQDVIPSLPEMYDEPFSDSSQIPTYLVSAMTKKHVTVALSGDGGDELFAGYNRYFQANNLNYLFNYFPFWGKKITANMIRTMPSHYWDEIFRLVPAKYRPPQAGDKMHKLANILTLDRQFFYKKMISHWHEPDEIVIGGQEKYSILDDSSLFSTFQNNIEFMQYADSVTYLPDDILTKVDRASMAVSLEARVPLLDHRVVEFAWSLPQSAKVRDRKGKWILRQILKDFVPSKLYERPKMGFGIPLEKWLRGSLRDWAEDLLSPTSFKEFGLLESAPILQKWHEHQSGAHNWQYLIWDVLMLHAWLRYNKK